MALTGFEVGALVVHPIAIAAATDVTNSPMLRTRRKIKVISAYFGTQETVTGHATAYVSLQIMAGTSTLAYLSTVTSAGSTLTGGVMTAMNLVAAKAEVASAQSIVFKAISSGNGTVIATPCVQLEFNIID